MTSNGYANAVGRLYRPSLTGTSKADALGTMIAYQDGMRASNDVNQYLQQRACYENNWMAALNESSVPATLVWGEEDPVCTTVVSDYVWSASLSVRPNAPARYIKVPDGGHYVCHDQPQLFACLIRDPLGACPWWETSIVSVEAGSTYPEAGSGSGSA